MHVFPNPVTSIHVSVDHVMEITGLVFPVGQVRYIVMKELNKTIMKLPCGCIAKQSMRAMTRNSKSDFIGPAIIVL